MTAQPGLQSRDNASMTTIQKVILALAPDQAASGYFLGRKLRWSTKETAKAVGRGLKGDAIELKDAVKTAAISIKDAFIGP